MFLLPRQAARAGRLLARLSLLVAVAPSPLSAAVPDRPATAPAAGRTVRRIDVGGHRLAYVVLGEGHAGPTVVVEPGLGLAAVESGEWKQVAAEIAKTNRVVLYDRAGLGASDPAPKTAAVPATAGDAVGKTGTGGPARRRTSRDAARDLHRLLAAAKVPGPYVLVGHSVGGLHVRAYADLYPAEVAGVVLVDATHPDQEARWLAALPAEAADESPAVKQARAFLKARLAARDGTPEGLDLMASREQVRAARPLGAKPLAVLTHSPDWKMVPQLPDDLSTAFERETQALQAGTAALSSNSTHVVAKRAGHAIHVDEPELVVAAIREVTGKAKH